MKVPSFISRLVFLCVALMLSIASLPAEANDEASTTITFLDVGYADAIYIGAKDKKHYLIDVGGSVLDFLKEKNIEVLEVVVLTHAHVNHYQGLNELLGKINIKQVIVNSLAGPEDYPQLLDQLREHNIPIHVLDNQKKVFSVSNTATITLMCHVDDNDGLNDNSIQSYVQDGESSIWLTSDIGNERQDFYLSRYPQLKEADVLQVPHHGDTISDDMQNLFLDRPAIVSTGTNKWGMPNSDALNQWRAPVYRTDEDGMITLTVKEESWRIQTKR